MSTGIESEMSVEGILSRFEHLEMQPGIVYEKELSLITILLWGIQAWVTLEGDRMEMERKTGNIPTGCATRDTMDRYADAIHMIVHANTARLVKCANKDMPLWEALVHLDEECHKTIAKINDERQSFFQPMH